MSAKFDVKACARSLSKLMAAADVTITKPGGAIHTQRLIDYCSNELQGMTDEQSLAVLETIDKDFQSKLLRDGNGSIMGFLYSRKIFILMPKEQQQGQRQLDFANMFVNNNKKRATRSKRSTKSRK